MQQLLYQIYFFLQIVFSCFRPFWGQKTQKLVQFTYKKGINYIKYSISDNDSNLLNSGYTKTGNTKEF